MDRKKFITGLMAFGAMPAAAGTVLSILPARAEDSHFTADAKYTANEITQAGSDFFGITTEAMAKGVEHVFGDLGEPDAYIKGDEGSGAFVVGLRYGSGWLIRKNRDPMQVYCLEMLHAGLQPARGPAPVPALPRRRRHLLSGGGAGHQLPTLGRRDAGPHAHGRRPARGRQRAVPSLYRQARLVSAVRLRRA
jgi:hypothetical protein